MSQRQPPSEEEQAGYFYGLPSGAKLIARSGTEPWAPRYSGSHLLGKELRPVGNHAINSLWNSESGPGSLQYDVMESLKDIRWTVIDIIRIPYQGDKGKGPVVVLITVDSKLVSWADADRVVTACKDVLKAHDITDVECEMKESCYLQLL